VKPRPPPKASRRARTAWSAAERFCRTRNGGSFNPRVAAGTATRRRVRRLSPAHGDSRRYARMARAGCRGMDEASPGTAVRPATEGDVKEKSCQIRPPPPETGTALRSAIIGPHDDTKPWVVAVAAAVGLYLIPRTRTASPGRFGVEHGLWRRLDGVGRQFRRRFGFVGWRGGVGRIAGIAHGVAFRLTRRRPRVGGCGGRPFDGLARSFTYWAAALCTRPSDSRRCS
jgi:hypothetical protein